MTDILVVEDEPRIANLCGRLLARLGHTARIVGTAREALEILARVHEPLAAAYIDVGLPDGSGLDVAREARRLRPSLPIVIATGSITDVESNDTVLLNKPFTLDRFQEAVNEALTKGVGGGAT